MQSTKLLVKFGLCLMILSLALFMVTGAQATDPKQASNQLSKGRAVSLKVLEERVKECMAKGECPKKILEFCGLKKICGFVIDEKNRDLILVGKVDTTSFPPLYLEDFVIALRNAWWKYAPLRGNTYYYSAPGCSIDPNPKTIQRLQQVGRGILSGSGEMQNTLRKWHTICGEYQKVRVLGIPFDSRFAKITVDADYYMKRLVNGSVSLGVEGFESLTDMTLNKAKEDVIQNRPISIPLSCLNRFWFFPGENRYVEDKGVVLIKRCQVKLLTEEEFLTKRGQVAGTGQANPFAQRFSENFTTKYSEIAEKRQIYAELEDLFRFVALAKVMKFQAAPLEAGVNLDYLLNRYPIRRIYVNRTLPGLSHVKGFEHRRDFPGGYQIAQLSLPSCGGVSIDIRISKANFVSDKTGRLHELRQAVLKARPSSDALYWNFPAMSIEELGMRSNKHNTPCGKNRRKSNSL